MNKPALWAVARKDMKAILANHQVWLPMLIVPLLLGVVIPTLMVGLLAAFGIQGDNDFAQMAEWLGRLPPSPLKAAVDSFPTLDQKVAYFAANYLFAPFFLMIPLMAAGVISADSFAGEKERGTLETLLYAPVDLLSLFTGKVLAALIPSVILSLVTFVLTAVSVNLAGWSLMGRIFFPQLNWLPLMLLVIPMISLTAILITVFVSARVTSFQAAYQMSGLLVIPAILLVLGQVSGFLLLDTPLLLAIGLGLGALNYVLLRALAGQMDRNRLFESQVR